MTAKKNAIATALTRGHNRVSGTVLELELHKSLTFTGRTIPPGLRLGNPGQGLLRRIPTGRPSSLRTFYRCNAHHS